MPWPTCVTGCVTRTAATDGAGLAAARTRNDTARDAQGTVQLLETKIAGLTPTQPLLDLAAGPDALKLFVAGVPAESPAADEDDISTDQLTRRLEEEETVVVRAETLHAQPEIGRAQGRERGC